MELNSHPVTVRTGIRCSSVNAAVLVSLSLSLTLTVTHSPVTVTVTHSVTVTHCHCHCHCHCHSLSLSLCHCHSLSLSLTLSLSLSLTHCHCHSLCHSLCHCHSLSLPLSLTLSLSLSLPLSLSLTVTVTHCVTVTVTHCPVKCSTLQITSTFICYLIITNFTCLPVLTATHTTVMQCVLPMQSAFILRTYLHPVFCEWIRHKHGKICNAFWLQNLDNHHSNKLLERIQVCRDVALCSLRVQRVFEMCGTADPTTRRHIPKTVTLQS
jgi:hypothetical protein